MELSETFFIFGAPVFFVVIWVFISFHIARNGWAKLANAYLAKSDFFGERFWLRSGRIGKLAGYGGSLFFGANSQGLYISVLFLFRIGHPPLFIPWKDIVRTTEVRVSRFPGVQLEFEKCSEYPLAITKKLAQSLAEASGGAFKLE